MWSALYWLYVINAVLIINHEIDSAYWREWNLFLPSRQAAPGSKEDRRAMAGFLLAHLPLVMLVMIGLVEVFKRSAAGLVLSLVLSAGGVFAFAFHTICIRRGRPEFDEPVSMFILWATVPVSLTQAALAGAMLF